MAHIQIRKNGGKPPTQLIINGMDVSLDAYNGFELVEVGDDPECAEIGFRVTFVVSRLDLDAEADVDLTDNLYPVATRVRSMSEAS